MATATATSASNKPEDTAGLTQWKIYQAIMTPINFITFIISLYLVDNRYQAQRARGHHHHQHHISRALPTWLHRLLFRPQPQLQPYGWVNNNNNSSSDNGSKDNNDSNDHKRPIPSANGMRRSSRGEERWYYHTQQKKLLRMEAADAFELRNTVLLALCAVGLAVATLAWWLGRRALPPVLGYVRYAVAVK
ncbi:hypothetical protein F5X99DRAFT_336409 [Biscogniauxia marginata]|nr:hypothetical protein F5X99DRAFT_336409 [Biscogniauxia marginata]